MSLNTAFWRCRILTHKHRRLLVTCFLLHPWMSAYEWVTWIVPRFSKISSALQISRVRTLDESSITRKFPVKLGIEWLLMIGFTTFAHQKCVKVRSGPRAWKSQPTSTKLHQVASTVTVTFWLASAGLIWHGQPKHSGRKMLKNIMTKTSWRKMCVHVGVSIIDHQIHQMLVLWKCWGLTWFALSWLLVSKDADAWKFYGCRQSPSPPQSQPGGRRSGVCRTFPPEGLGICHGQRDRPPVDPQHWASSAGLDPLG